MLRSRILRLLVVALACAALAGAADGPPATPTHPVIDTIHGVAITDPYRWLEDQNSPETRAWIDAQNVYTQKVLSQ
jgi:prolyl oligopeptidase